VLVLGELLQQPGHCGVVTFHDVGRDARQADLACGEHSALPDPERDGAVVVAAAADWGEDAVFADGCHECGVEFDGGADVGFHVDLVGVDVLDGAERCGVSHVLTLLLSI